MLRFAPWKIVSIIAMIAAAVLVVVPSLLPVSTRAALDRALPSWAQPKILTLGLDLQGGSHILLKVDREDVIKTMVANLRDDVRRILRDEKVAAAGGIQSQANGVQFRLADATEDGKIKQKLQNLASPSASILGSSGAAAYDLQDDGSGTIRLTLTEAGDHRQDTAGRRAVDRGHSQAGRRAGYHRALDPARG